MFNKKQQQIFIGSMLGDGCIIKNSYKRGPCIYRYQITQSKFDYVGDDKKLYMDYFTNEFDNFSTNVISRTQKATGLVKKLSKKKQFHNYTFYTYHLKFWEKLESKWYVPRTDHHFFKRRKIIPADLKLTPLSLCIWHMDDGNNNPKDANIELNTQGFTTEEVGFLIERLKQDLSIESHKKSAYREDQNKIYVGRDSYFDFIEMIKPHVEWDCFKYKIDTSAYNKQPHRGETHSNSKLTEDIIREVFKLRDEGMLQKDIARKLEIAKSNVSFILCGKRWNHMGLQRPRIIKKRINKKIKEEMFKLREVGKSQYQIAEILNVNQSTVSRTLNQGV